MPAFLLHFGNQLARQLISYKTVKNQALVTMRRSTSFAILLAYLIGPALQFAPAEFVSSNGKTNVRFRIYEVGARVVRWAIDVLAPGS